MSKPYLSGVVLILSMILSGTALAKNLRTGIDFTSESLWQNHSISIGQVVRMEGKTARFKIVQAISGPTNPGERSGVVVTPLLLNFLSPQQAAIPSGTVRLSFWDENETPRLRAGDYLLLVENAFESGFVSARRIRGAGDPFVKSVVQIAELRKGAPPMVLAQAALSPETIVADYALKRLIATPDLRDGLRRQPEYSKLLEQRNDKKRDSQTRLLTQTLASLLDAPEADQEYAWLQQVLTRERKESSDLFLDRLLSHTDRREDTVTFLIGIVKDVKMPTPFRSTVSSYLSDRRVYDYEKPSASSERIVATCIELLKDSSALIRSDGSATLDSIVRNIKNNGEKQRVSALAASAIGQALKKEKDKETQASFENDLLSLSGEFYPPELRKQFPDLPNPRR